MTAGIEEAREARISRRMLLGAAGAAFALVLGFAVFSGQIWEDYFITFRSSRNLAEGHGLVYQIGERIHTFTSPLGVLLPAASFAVTGNDVAALWLFRTLSALALAGAAALVVAHAREHAWSRGAVWAALLLGVFEAKVVAFSSNGMETGFLLLFAALTWRELTRPAGPRVRWLALGFAGLMWTRPDAFVFAGAISLGWWLFGPRPLAASERTGWRRWAAAMLLGGLLYAPWFFWAWHYYGSPIPQTIIAKAAYTPGGFSLARIFAAPLRCLVTETALDGLFAPIYANAGGWPRDFIHVAQLLAKLAAFLWIAPGLPRATRAASFATLVGGVYFHQIMPYPWYYGPWTLLGAIALAGAGADLAKRVRPKAASLVRVVGGVTAGGALLVTVVQAECCRLQQNLIENGGRKQIGLWLREHARPGDTVFLEPIGYVGYFSQLKILDFPGLTEPRVSQLIRAGRGSYANIISALQPTWIVLRLSEINDQRLDGEALRDYDVVGHWDAHPALERQAFLPGAGWLSFDAEFLVFHRHAAGAPVANGG